MRVLFTAQDSQTIRDAFDQAKPNAEYAPAIGFLHTGKPLSFVYDVADVFKFETVVPEAFRIAG
jgi:CRISPR/Cas system-associated endonuclease Cas1